MPRAFDDDLEGAWLVGEGSGDMVVGNGEGVGARVCGVGVVVAVVLVAVVVMVGVVGSDFVFAQAW